MLEYLSTYAALISRLEYIANTLFSCKQAQYTRQTLVKTISYSQ